MMKAGAFRVGVATGSNGQRAMTWRSRLGLLVGAAMAVALAAGAYGGALPPSGGQTGIDQLGRAPGPGARGVDPLFVFAIIADSHISSSTTSDSKYIKANDKSQELLAVFVRDINAHDPAVDFVVHLGDVTEGGTASQFKAARRILDSLKCPMYPVVGNHDNFESDNKAGWKEFAGRESTTYAFDFSGFHFIVIDCTEDPYVPGGVTCDRRLREWVGGDLARNRDKPTVLFSHYNMWERGWNSQFDTTHHYQEYRGMRELRKVLEGTGNVVAVINGHVHANRMESHNGICYIDVGATLVGRPSIRYFYVFADRVEASYAYISDCALLDYVVKVSRGCLNCFDSKKVADFADGEVSDKQFTILLKPLAPH